MFCSISKVLVLVSVFSLSAAFADVAPVSTGKITGRVTSMPPKFLADTVVFIKNVPGNYEARTLIMDQQKMSFIPRVLAVTARDTVQFWNHDSMMHDVFSSDNEKYNLGSIKTGENRPYTFAKEGSYAQLCHFHPEMIAYVFVGQNPFSVVVDSTGNYSLENVPAGTYEVATWNPKLKSSGSPVTVTVGQEAKANFSIHR